MNLKYKSYISFSIGTRVKNFLQPIIDVHSFMLRLFSAINYSTGERLQKLLLQILLLQKHIICLMAFYLCWFLRLQGKVIGTNCCTSWRGIFALLNSRKSHDSICMLSHLIENRHIYMKAFIIYFLFVITRF